MTDVATAPDLLHAVLTEAANAVTTKLPLTGVAGPPLGAQEPAALVPGEQARAVTVGVVGARRGTLVLALASAVAAALEDGPLGPQDLAAALEPALVDALVALGAAFGESVHLEAAQALDADLALSTVAESAASDDLPFAAVPILDGEAHVATIALVMTGEPEAPAEDQHPGAMLPEFDNGVGTPAGAAPSALELLGEVEMNVTAELGRTRMTVRDLLALTPGAVVELDRAAGSAIDLLVNGTLIARGEIVVIDEEFGVRISEIVERDQPRRR